MPQQKIFISYSSDADRTWIERLYRSLQQEGFEPWLDYLRIPPGEAWQDHLEQALRTSETILVVISPQSENRVNVWFELGVAKSMGKRSILLLPEGYDAAWIPSDLRGQVSLTQQSPEDTARAVAVLLKSNGDGESRPQV